MTDHGGLYSNVTVRDAPTPTLLREREREEIGAAHAFRRAMDIMYWTGAAVSCFALVLISAIIPWAVYTRYILNSAASWPEPLAVLLTVAVTFIGAANCYRQRIHMNMTVGTNLLPPRARVVGMATAGVPPRPVLVRAKSLASTLLTTLEKVTVQLTPAEFVGVAPTRVIEVTVGAVLLTMTAPSSDVAVQLLYVATMR